MSQQQQGKMPRQDQSQHEQGGYGASSHTPDELLEGGLQAKPPRLTEEEKKMNHIASERKRRDNIRAQFDRLAAIIPGCEGQARSEGLILSKAVDFSQYLIDRRYELVSQIEALGGTVREDLRE
ncbi:hypothetical protein S40293_00409 [Stachybotrys chartarum IBT 40293]|nr:hypothetical protein S40293_00409 [Stachybotrys chartarum IBT 40293]